jgi:Hint domain
METGFRATFMISWAQTEIDGLQGAGRDQIILGTNWRWGGTALRIDVPRGPLILGSQNDAADQRSRAARVVTQLVRSALVPGETHLPQRLSMALSDGSVSDDGFVVTDGLRTFPITIIDVPETGATVLMAVEEMPPADQDLWVTKVVLDPAFRPKVETRPAGIICFGHGTRLTTPDGLRPIESLRPGDLVDTKDNGPQPILWTGHRRMSGARLHAMPHLRPIRFRSGAMGTGRPDDDLIVSPQHRMLVASHAVRDLFNSDEVLVQAAHLLNGTSVVVDHLLREVTYVHVLLERHNVIWANGLETESFHPAHMDLPSLDADQHASLLEVLPEIAGSAETYGDDVRRNVTAPEAAILRHEIAA